jgi:excisionase family DNA binding protein
MMFVTMEAQTRQTLDRVLRELVNAIELAHALIRAMPEQPQPILKNGEARTEITEAFPNGRLLVTMAEAAEMLSIGRTAFYRLVMEGQIRTIRIGRSRRVPMSVLQEYIDRLSKESM